MSAYVARRFGQAVLTLIVVSMVIFLLMKLYGGDPGVILLGRSYTPAKAHAIDVALGMALPWPMQYLRWLRLLFAGGLSGAFGTLPASLLLLVLGGGIGLALAVGAASVQARFPHSWADRVTSALSLIFYTFPSFWVAGLLSLWFVFELGWLPMVPPGMPGNTGFGSWALTLVIPVLSLALTSVAAWSLHLRVAFDEAFASDYVRTARAKGLPERAVVRRHVLRNGLLPLLSILGMSYPVLLSNLIVLEPYFTQSGIGGAIFAAIGMRAYGSMLDVVLVLGILVIGANLLTDIAIACVDPRVRFS